MTRDLHGSSGGEGRGGRGGGGGGEPERMTRVSEARAEAKGDFLRGRGTEAASDEAALLEFVARGGAAGVCSRDSLGGATRGRRGGGRSGVRAGRARILERWCRGRRQHPMLRWSPCKPQHVGPPQEPAACGDPRVIHRPEGGRPRVGLTGCPQNHPQKTRRRGAVCRPRNPPASRSRNFVPGRFGRARPGWHAHSTPSPSRGPAPLALHRIDHT